MADPTELTMVVAFEETVWGDAGIGKAIMGSGLAAAGIAGNGTPEQMMSGYSTEPKHGSQTVVLLMFTLWSPL